MGMAALDIKRVSKSFGKVKALQNVTIAVDVGEIVGLIGCNGAGKSTLIRLITGQMQPTEGTIEVLGERVVGEALGPKSVIGYVPDEDNILGKLTPNEYLTFVGKVRKVPSLPSRIKETLGFLEMANWSDHLIEGFSRGMKKRIQLAAAIIHGPKILIMDEPMSGFDPEMMAVIGSLVRALRTAGTTVLMSTHDLPLATEMCNRFLVLDYGVIKASGTELDLTRLTGTNSLMEAYLYLVNASSREGEANALATRLSNHR